MIQNVKRRDHCRDYKQLKNVAFRKIDVVCKNAILESVAEWRRTDRSEERRRAARIFEAFTDSIGRIFQLGIRKSKKYLDEVCIIVYICVCSGGVVPTIKKGRSKMKRNFFIELYGEDTVFQNLKYEGLGTLDSRFKIKSILLCNDCDSKLTRVLK